MPKKDSPIPSKPLSRLGIEDAETDSWGLKTRKQAPDSFGYAIFPFDWKNKPSIPQQISLFRPTSERYFGGFLPSEITAPNSR